MKTSQLSVFFLGPDGFRRAWELEYLNIKNCHDCPAICLGGKPCSTRALLCVSLGLWGVQAREFWRAKGSEGICSKHVLLRST